MLLALGGVSKQAAAPQSLVWVSSCCAKSPHRSLICARHCLWPRISEYDPTMSHGGAVWIYRVGETGSDIGQLAEGLSARGLSVTGPTDALPVSPVSLIVVAIAADSTAQPESVEKALDAWRGQLVPVVEGSIPSPVLGDLSQIMLDQLPMSQVVERVAQLSSIGGSVLAALVRLESGAQQWEAAGRKPDGLLRGSAIDRATAIVARASPVASSLVNEFARASVEARRRRNRILRAVAAVVAVILAAGSLIAFAQQQEANGAASLAHTRAAAAESVRLARLATTLIGTDPDLPWVLADKAFHESPTPQAVAAARRVLQTVPPHQSIELPGLPRRLAADPTTGTMILGYVDGSADLREGDNGELTYHFPVDQADSSGVSIAPGGGTIQIGQRVIDAKTHRTIATLTGHFAGWLDGGTALLVDDHKLVRLDISSGATSPTQILIDSPENFAFSVAAKAPVANFLDGDHLLSVDLNTGTALPPVTVDTSRGAGIATSDDGALVYVALPKGSKSFRRTGSGLTPEDTSGSGNMVVANGTTWAVGNNMLPVSQVGIASGTIAQTYLPHRGPIIGIGALPGGRTATIGADGYLRLWFPPPTIAYPQGEDHLQVDAFAFSLPSTRVLNRTQIVLSEDGATAIVSNPGLGRVGSLDSANLSKRSGLFVGVSPTGIVPLRNGQVFRYQPKDQGNGAFAIIDVSNSRVVWQSNLDAAVSGAVIGTADDTGSHVVFSGSSGMVSFDTNGSREGTSFDRTSTPIWVGIPDGVATTVTSEGKIYREGAPAVTLDDLGCPVAGAGAGPNGSMFVIGTDGTLAEEAGGRLRVITHLSTTIRAFTLRVSKDGSEVAVIGSAGGVVVRAADGSVLLDLTPLDDHYSAIRDVALAGNYVWEARADGGLLKVPLMQEDQIAAELDRNAPRAETATEIKSLAGVVTTVGAD